MTAILLAVTGLPGEPDLVAACQRRGVGLTVVRRCVDAADLLAAAATRSAAAAVVGPGLPRLSADTVARLEVLGIVVLGLVPDADEAAERALRRLGVALVVTASRRDAAASAHALARAVGETVAHRPARGGDGYASLRPGRRPGAEGSPGDPAGGVAAAAPPGAGGPDQLGAGPQDDAPVAPHGVGAVPAGRLVAVWGPTGAPGRTSVAVALADEAARAGLPALLVDADTYGAAVATALGLLDEASGIALACRAADAGRLDVPALAACARSLGPRLRVLTGLAQPTRWPELRPAALVRLWEACRALSPLTVVDTGFSLEQDEELVYDTLAPRRNAATLTALDAADVVIAVGAGDPVGMGRLLAGLGELRTLAPDTPVEVVISRVRRGPLGRDAERQIRTALVRHAGVTEPLLVPDDRAAFDACLRAGRTLAEQAPRSPARAALARLAGTLRAAS